MDGQSPCVERCLVAPHAFHQLAAREHLSWVRGEEVEEIELLARQLQKLALTDDITRARIELKPVIGQRLRSALPRLCPTQNCLDAHHELLRGERLREVVVGTYLEPDD